MNVLVDTAVWSLALRRARRIDDSIPGELTALLEEGRVAMMGAIRQELLSGIKSQAHFETLRDHLSAFPDLELATEDYEQAAAFFNRCRARGIQGSNTNFLICAVASRRDLSIFTTDQDFTHFAEHLPITLHSVRAG